MKIPSRLFLAALCLLAVLGAVSALASPGALWSAISTVREVVHQHHEDYAGTIILLYILTYMLVGALCLPGTGLLNLTGAGLFGPWVGLAVICFSRAAGGSLACISVRALFRERVLRRYGHRLAAVNQGFAKEGGFYLFALRLVPGLPYPVTNVAMGLTPIRLSSFFWITLIGSIPGCLVTINAVSRLGSMSTPSDIFSLQIVLSLALIGVLPLLLRRVVAAFRGGMFRAAVSTEAS
jgi:uncharacterized membrane protein YdjX (TVP38/TMEM64 family)